MPDSSVSVIPLSIRNTGLSEGLPTVWLSTQPALNATSGHRWYAQITHIHAHTHKILIHVSLILADIHTYGVQSQLVNTIMCVCGIHTSHTLIPRKSKSL